MPHKHLLASVLGLVASLLLAFCVAVPAFAETTASEADGGGALSGTSAAEASADVTSTGGIIKDGWASNWGGEGGKTHPVKMNPYANHDGALFIGNLSHYYVQVDLSALAGLGDDDLDAAEVTLNVHKWNRGGTYVITAASDNLSENGEDTTTPWTRDNLMYANRPIDLPDTKSVEQQVGYGDTIVNLDVKELALEALAAGKTSLTLHVTLSDAESGGENMSDLDSMTGATPATFTARVPAPVRPTQAVEATRTPSDLYTLNSSVAQKIFRIKTAAGAYLKAADDGSLTETSTAADASTFALYVYDPNLAGYSGEGEGWLRTTYAIKCLDSGKYLTTQNYTGNGVDAVDYTSVTYLNQLNGKNSKLELKANAPTVQWNERFVVNAFTDVSGAADGDATGTEYEILSHTGWSRDIRQDISVDVTYPTFPVRVSDDGTVYTDESDTDQYAFTFEDVSGADPLEVMQDVSGSTAELTWYPVNGDTAPASYAVSATTVSGAAVSVAAVTYDGELMHASLSGLEQGENSATVTHGAQTTTVAVRAFNHPGVSHTQDELDAMREHIANKEEPWYSDYQRMLTSVPDNMASADYEPTAIEAVGRGDYTPSGHAMGNYEKDGEAAYFNALQWVITGDDAHAEAVVRILNAWSGTLKTIDGRDRILGAGIDSFRFLNAAEIIRTYDGGYAGYSDEDFAAFEKMMANVVYPVIEDMGGAMYANGNWDLAGEISIVSMGTLFENTQLYDQALATYVSPYVNGSILNYVDEETGLTQELYRDQAHGQLGVGYLSNVCKVAESQGDDLWSLKNNALARSFEWAARYNLTGESETSYDPSTLPDITTGTQRYTSPDTEGSQRGELRPIYEAGLAHYSQVEGVDTTWMARAAAALRPEGFNHNDNLNFGTLTSYNGPVLETSAQPYFKLRTRQADYYTSNKFEGSLTSYYAVDDEALVRSTAMYADGSYFQLVTNADGTYSVRAVETNTYLRVADEKVGAYDVVRADAATAEEGSKFVLESMGANFYYLKCTDHRDGDDTYGRILKGVEEDGVFTLRLGNAGVGTDGTGPSADSMTDGYRDLFAVMYNTRETALAESGREPVDATALSALLTQAEAYSNDDGAYTEASFSVLQAAMARARATVGEAADARVDAAAVDAQAAELQAAIDGLEASGGEPGDGEPTTPGEPGTPGDGATTPDAGGATTPDSSDGGSQQPGSNDGQSQGGKSASGTGTIGKKLPQTSDPTAVAAMAGTGLAGSIAAVLGIRLRRRK